MLFNDGLVLQLRSETVAVRRLMIYDLDYILYVGHIQSGREISAIILADDYLSYKEPKIPFNFFLILIFNELKFETSDECNVERRRPLLCTARTSTFSVRSVKSSLRLLYNVAVMFRSENSHEISFYFT